MKTAKKYIRGKYNIKAPKVKKIEIMFDILTFTKLKTITAHTHQSMSKEIRELVKIKYLEILKVTACK